MALDRKKIALLHVAKKRCGFDDETWRLMLRHQAGVDSSRDLGPEGFDRVMAHLKRMGFESDASKRNYGERPGMATDAQVHLVRQLWQQWTDGRGTDYSLGRWLFRTFTAAHVKFLDQRKASKAIDALKAMVARKAQAAPETTPPPPPSPAS